MPHPTKPHSQHIKTLESISARAGLLLVLVLSVFAVAPLFYPGYIQTHNGFAPLWNVVDLQSNFGNFGWTPHIATNFNPLRSDGLLLYYLAALLPLPSVIAIKLIVGLAWVMGGVGIFLWLKSWVGNAGALVAALVYIYLPYQIATVYVRGAWGEVLFWGLLPWAILASTYLVTSPKIILVPVAAVFWLGLGLNQLGLTLWALAFLIALLLVVHFRQSLLPILSTVVGTGLAIVIYLLITPQTFLVSARTLFADHFLYPFQLVSAYWGFGSSRTGFDDGLSLQVGLAALGLAILTVYLWQRGSNKQVSRTDRRLIFFLGAAVVLGLLQFGLAGFIWNLPIWPGYSLSDTLTYSWQLLGLIGLCLSVLAGAALWLDSHLTRLPLLAAIILIIILSVYSYLLPQFVQSDSYPPTSPQAQLGDNQLALLDYGFDVLTPGYTAGVDQGHTSIPLAVNGPLHSGNTLLVNVAWQPLQTLAENLKVFVHLVDSNNNVLAQFDGYPLEGTYPTSQWIPGEIINDTYPILVPANSSPSPYRVFIGLYDEATLERLPVSTDSEGRVILDVQ